MSWSKHDGGRSGPRGYHHGNLKEALLRAALELIAKKGPAGFTFAEAARWAGVSPAAPYHHFCDSYLRQDGWFSWYARGRRLELLEGWLTGSRSLFCSATLSGFRFHTRPSCQATKIEL